MPHSGCSTLHGVNPNLKKNKNVVTLDALVFRSSSLQMFYKIGVLENFAKFTEKLLCQGLYFNKVAGLKAGNLFRKRLWHRCFPVNFAKF